MTLPVGGKVSQQRERLALRNRKRRDAIAELRSGAAAARLQQGDAAGRANAPSARAMRKARAHGARAEAHATAALRLTESTFGRGELGSRAGAGDAFAGDHAAASVAVASYRHEHARIAPQEMMAWADTDGRTLASRVALDPLSVGFGPACDDEAVTDQLLLAQATLLRLTGCSSLSAKAGNTLVKEAPRVVTSAPPAETTATSMAVAADALGDEGRSHDHTPGHDAGSETARAEQARQARVRSLCHACAAALKETSRLRQPSLLLQRAAALLERMDEAVLSELAVRAACAVEERAARVDNDYRLSHGFAQENEGEGEGADEWARPMTPLSYSPEGALRLSRALDVLCEWHLRRDNRALALEAAAASLRRCAEAASAIGATAARVATAAPAMATAARMAASATLLATADCFLNVALLLRSRGDLRSASHMLGWCRLLRQSVARTRWCAGVAEVDMSLGLTAEQSGDVASACRFYAAAFECRRRLELRGGAIEALQILNRARAVLRLDPLPDAPLQLAPLKLPAPPYRAAPRSSAVAAAPAAVAVASADLVLQLAKSELQRVTENAVGVAVAVAAAGKTADEDAWVDTDGCPDLDPAAMLEAAMAPTRAPSAHGRSWRAAYVGDAGNERAGDGDDENKSKPEGGEYDARGVGTVLPPAPESSIGVWRRIFVASGASATTHLGYGVNWAQAFGSRTKRAARPSEVGGFGPSIMADTAMSDGDGGRDTVTGNATGQGENEGDGGKDKSEIDGVNSQAAAQTSAVPPASPVLPPTGTNSLSHSQLSRPKIGRRSRRPMSARKSRLVRGGAELTLAPITQPLPSPSVDPQVPRPRLQQPDAEKQRVVTFATSVDPGNEAVHIGGLGPDVGSNRRVDPDEGELPAWNSDAPGDVNDDSAAAAEAAREYETAWDPRGALPMKWNAHVDNFGDASDGESSAGTGSTVCWVPRVLSPQREDELLLLLRMVATDLSADARSRRAAARAAKRAAKHAGKRARGTDVTVDGNAELQDEAAAYERCALARDHARAGLRAAAVYAPNSLVKQLLGTTASMLPPPPPPPDTISEAASHHSSSDESEDEAEEEGSSDALIAALQTLRTSLTRLDATSCATLAKLRPRTRAMLGLGLGIRLGSPAPWPCRTKLRRTNARRMGTAGATSRGRQSEWATVPGTESNVAPDEGMSAIDIVDDSWACIAPTADELELLRRALHSPQYVAAAAAAAATGAAAAAAGAANAAAKVCAGTSEEAVAMPFRSHAAVLICPSVGQLVVETLCSPGFLAQRVALISCTFQPPSTPSLPLATQQLASTPSAASIVPASVPMPRDAFEWALQALHASLELVRRCCFAARTSPRLAGLLRLLRGLGDMIDGTVEGAQVGDVDGYGSEDANVAAGTSNFRHMQGAGADGLTRVMRLCVLTTTDGTTEMDRTAVEAECSEDGGVAAAGAPTLLQLLALRLLDAQTDSLEAELGAGKAGRELLAFEADVPDLRAAAALDVDAIFVAVERIADALHGTTGAKKQHTQSGHRVAGDGRLGRRLGVGGIAGSLARFHASGAQNDDAFGEAAAALLARAAAPVAALLEAEAEARAELEALVATVGGAADEDGASDGGRAIDSVVRGASRALATLLELQGAATAAVHQYEPEAQVEVEPAPPPRPPMPAVDDAPPPPGPPAATDDAPPPPGPPTAMDDAPPPPGPPAATDDAPPPPGPPVAADDAPPPPGPPPAPATSQVVRVSRGASLASETPHKSGVLGVKGKGRFASTTQRFVALEGEEVRLHDGKSDGDRIKHKIHLGEITDVVKVKGDTFKLEAASGHHTFVMPKGNCEQWVSTLQRAKDAFIARAADEGDTGGRGASFIHQHGQA